MAFYVTVTQGADEGKTFQVEPGECIIGRSPSSTIVLQDESIAWEHVMLREVEGRLTVENLSAAGTKVKGRRVTAELKLASNDEIQLTEQCRVVVTQKAGSGPRRVSKRARLLLVVFVGLIVLIAGTVWWLQPAEPPRRQFTHDHWRHAFSRIEDRLERWTDRNDFPEEALTVYRDAWRLEQALNPAAASERWERMRAMLLTIPFTRGNGKEVRIAEMGGDDSRTLRVIAGYDTASSSTDFQWNTDDAYADALVWFVRNRAKYSRLRAEKER